MNTKEISLKALSLIAVALLALGVLQLWWHGANGGDGKGEKHMAVGTPVVEGDGGSRSLPMGGEEYVPPPEGQFSRQEVERLVQTLQSDTDPIARRSAAFRLQYLVDGSLEPFLLKMLRDPDELVAQRCSKALLTLWEESHSPSVTRLFHQGMTAYEAGNAEEALARFEMCAELDPAIPDLPRLRAEILLDKGRAQEALEQCRHAAALKKDNFMAYYVMARCQRALGDRDALQSVDKALSIYPSYAPACQLRVEILSLQRGGEL